MKFQWSFLTQSHLFTNDFSLISIFLLYKVMHLLTLLLIPLILTCILSVVLCPIHWKVCPASQKTGFATAITAFVCQDLIIDPAVTLLLLLVMQVITIYQWTSAILQAGTNVELWTRYPFSFLTSFLPLPAVSANSDLWTISRTARWPSSFRHSQHAACTYHHNADNCLYQDLP